MIWSKGELRSQTVDQMILYSYKTQSHESAAVSTTDSLLHLHVPTGSFFFFNSQAHRRIVKFHTHTHGLDHKHGAGLGPSEKSHAEFSSVLTTVPLWHDKQTPHELQTGDEVSAETRAVGEAANNIFTEEPSGCRGCWHRICCLSDLLSAPLLKRVTLVVSSGGGKESFWKQEKLVFHFFQRFL